MWPLALDIWLEEDKNDEECKWWTEGGSEAFYRLFFVWLKWKIFCGEGPLANSIPHFHFSFSWICFQGFYARVPHQKVWQRSRPCHRTVRKGGWGQTFINCTQPTSILIVIIPRTRTRKASSTASSNQCSRLWRKGEDGVWLYNHFMMITISLYDDVLQCIVEISYQYIAQ